MPSIRHLQFGGLRPAAGRKLLPPPYAEVAHNAELRNGELCPYDEPRVVTVCDQSHIYLMPESGEIKCADGCIVPFYDAVCGGTPAAAIFLPGRAASRCLPDGSEAPLVPPMPTTAPVATVVDDVQPTDENGPDARVYVYTWVNQFGYESPPSPASNLVSGSYLNTYQLTLEAPPAEVVCVRIYRMVSAQDNNYEQETVATAFQLVREIDPAGSFFDDVMQVDMEMGELLTIDNCPPPDMDCVYEIEAGYLVGWSGREVYFSERGEPHNWPDRYRFTLAHDVVGGAVAHNSVYLGTTGTPYRIDVAQPGGDSDVAQFNVYRYRQHAPLAAADAITCTDFGAAMSSRGGVWRLGPDRAELTTRGRIDEDVWDEQYAPTLLVWHNSRLFGHGGPAGGFVLGWHGGENALDIGDLVTIDWNPSRAHAGTDGKLYYLEGGVVYEWDAGDDPMTYTWKSGTTRTPGDMSWSAMKIVGDFTGGREVTVRVTNDECGLYDTQVVTESTIYRVPCHPKGVHWQIEIEGNACICEAHLATSKNELTERGTGGENAPI